MGTDSTYPWWFGLNGANVSELTADFKTPAMPKAGQSYDTDQLKDPLIQLSEGGTWWASVSGSGDVSLHVDNVISASNVSGTLAGSLVKDDRSDGGVQICIIF